MNIKCYTIKPAKRIDCRKLAKKTREKQMRERKRMALREGVKGKRRRRRKTAIALKYYVNSFLKNQDNCYLSKKRLLLSSSFHSTPLLVINNR